MKQSKHTPTPWATIEDQSLHYYYIYSHNSTSNGVLAELPKRHNEGKANAEFIVKAANNYDALVALLKRTMGPLTQPEVRAVIKEAQALLNKLEQE